MQESERQRALDAYAILDTPRESGFQEITQLVAELCDVPSATITFVDRDRTWMKAATGHGLAELPRARSFCGFAIEERGLTVIRDTALDPRCREIESAQADRPVRFYAGAPIVTPDGHTLGMLCVTDYHPRDLTPQQHRVLETLGKQVIAQLELRRRGRDAALERDQFFQLSVDPMCITDRTGKFRKVNQAFANVLGLTVEEVERETYVSLLHPEDVAGSIEYGMRLFESAMPLKFENRYRTKTGEWRYIQWNSLYVPAIRRFFGIARDVTEQKQLEAQLRQSQKMDAVGQLAGGIAHDFNNLLSAITGFTALARDQLPEDSPIREDLVEVTNAADRAANLTRQLLAFGRKSVAESPRTTNLDALVGDVDKMLRRLIGENIALVVTKSPELWNVRVDRTQMEQVLINLIVNARDAMPRGGTIRIETSNVMVPAKPGIRAGAYARLTVSDTGVGMTAEVQTRIFEPFFTTKDIGKGTGLGLATVFGIVKQSGGHITVESAPGRGTTFAVDLPRTMATELGMAPLVKAEPRGTETIMLVEDDDAVRGFAKRGLTRLGYTVVEASNGEQAMELAARSEVQLLLTDVIMPGISGPELAAKIRGERPTLKVMFMSGYTRNALEPNMLEQGRSHFVEKPIAIATLGHALRDLLDSETRTTRGTQPAR